MRAMRVLVLILASIGGAHAAEWDSTRAADLRQVGPSSVRATPGSILAPHAQSLWLPAGAGQRTLSTVGRGPGPTVAGVDVRVLRTITAPNVARGIVRRMPAVSGAVLIGQLLIDARMRQGPGGSVEWLPDIQPAIALRYCFQGRQTLGDCGPTQAEATSRHVVTWNGAAVPQPSGSRDCVIEFRRVDPGNAERAQFQRGVWLNARPTSDSPCPSYDPARFPLGSWIPMSSDFTRVVGAVCPSGTQQWGTRERCISVTNWQVVDEAPAVDRLAPRITDQNLEGVGNELYGRGVPIPHDSPVVVPEGPPIVERGTSQLPDGRTIVVDRTYEFIPVPGGYDWRHVTREREFGPGETIPPPGAVTGGTVNRPLPVNQDMFGCGLPGRPPCAIDESGTPAFADPFPAVLEPVFAPIRGVLENPPVADTAWTFSFSMPTHCAPIALDFHGTPVVFDMCQWQPMIHDIMSIIWAITGIFFAVWMVGRTLGT